MHRRPAANAASLASDPVRERCHARRPAHSGVRRFVTSLARAGNVVFVPDLPGIASGELSPRTLAAAVECATAGADAGETRGGRIGLVGVSIGGTLALLVAAVPELAARISVVAAIAPFTDLEKVMMLATTGMYRGSGRPEPYPVPPSLAVGLARSLVAALPPTPDVRALALALERLDPLSPDPLRALRDSPCRSLGHGAATARPVAEPRLVSLCGSLRRAPRGRTTRRGHVVSAAIGGEADRARRDRDRAA